MSPVKFPEANTRFGPPQDLADSQCLTIYGYAGQVENGSLDGAQIVVTAWKPSPDELERLNKGEPVFLCCIGGLPAHYICTSFKEAVSIA